VKRLRRLIDPDPTMTCGQDLWLQGGQSRDGPLCRGPVPGAAARRAEHPLSAGYDAEQRVQVHGHDCIAGDQHPVLAPVQVDVAGGVTWAVDCLPFRQPRYTSVEIERLFD